MQGICTEYDYIFNSYLPQNYTSSFQKGIDIKILSLYIRSLKIKESKRNIWHTINQQLKELKLMLKGV